MAFDEVRFPEGISYGSTGGPGFMTNIITMDSGQETRVARWSASRRRYNAAYGVKSYADLGTLITFYMARQGAARGFRFKDFLDFTTASDHRSAHANTDVQIGVGDASTTTFQLIKKYTNGSVTRTRTIVKPVSGTTVIALDGVNQASGWSVNTVTGVVTFTSAPGSGVLVTAGFEFDVPVRFGEDLDSVLDVSIDSFDSGSLPAITLVELIDPQPNYEDFFYGGSVEISSADNISISVGNGLMQVITMTAASKTVTLPNPASIPTGGPIFFLVNGGPTHSWALKDHNAVTLVTLSAGQSALVFLTINGSSVKVWYTA